jgi:hypothetical protein
VERKPPVEEDLQSENEPEVKNEIKLIPTLDYFQKNYGRSMEGNDMKAVRVFKDYEPAEKVRRLQHELIMIKDQRVSEKVLDAIVGKKRKSKYQGYHLWAERMLMWIVAKKL